MPGSHLSFALDSFARTSSRHDVTRRARRLTAAVFSFVALGLGLVPTAARAASSSPAKQPAARSAKTAPCAKTTVQVVAGAETASVPLAQCDGAVDPLAVDELSILGRPGSAPKPAESLEALSKIRGVELAPGVRRLDVRLVERLKMVAEHFAKDGAPTKIVLVSGVRPRNSGSYHSAGRALDFRIEGVKDDALVAFCKTLPDTGCGYYPNNVFVHMDVRDPGTGHVAWVDTSKPTDAAPEANRETAVKPEASPAICAVPKPEAREAAATTEKAKKEGEKRELAGDGSKPAATVAMATPGLSMAVPVATSETKEAKPETKADSAATNLPALPRSDAASGERPARHHRHHARKTHDKTL